MDDVDQLLRQGQNLGISSTEKHLLISAIALTLYDYLLMFDEEIRYVWNGRKTYIFYLYILNRILLVAWQFWLIYYASFPVNSETACLVGYYIHLLLLVFFSCSSDIFIMLRIYGITLRNKILVACFGTLSLAKLAMSLVAIFTSSPVVADSPPAPADAFGLCELVTNPRFGLVPCSIGTAFELSAFIVVVWCTYRHSNTPKLSALIRTVVEEATMYFLIMVAAQTYSLIGGRSQQLSLFTYGLFSPILTLRFAISLKKSADPEGGQKWQLKHFSTLCCAGSPAIGTERLSSVSETTEMEPTNRSA